MHVILILRMTLFTMEDWRKLPPAGRSIGTIGKGIWCLWEWTLTYRIPPSLSKSDSSLALLQRQQVKNCTVSSTLTTINQTIELAYDSNPAKVVGSKRLLP